MERTEGGADEGLMLNENSLQLILDGAVGYGFFFTVYAFCSVDNFIL